MLTKFWSKWIRSFQEIQATMCPAANRRRSRWSLGSVEALEIRVLPAANVAARLVGGSLILTDTNAGSQSLQIARDGSNPALVDVTPGPGTTVNGRSTPAQFLLSQLTRDITLVLNDGTSGSGGTHVAIDGTGLTIRGSISVSVLGQGPDTIDIQNAGMGGALLVNTGDGLDRIRLSSVQVGTSAGILPGAGADVVTIQKSAFHSAFFMDGGIQGGDTLNIDDTTFDQSATVNMWTSGNQINVERDTSLPGSTMFRGPASFNDLGVKQPGGGGEMNVGLQNPATQVYFAGAVTFRGANVRTAVAATHFNGCAPCYICCTQAGVDITTTTLPDWTVGQPGYNQPVTTDGGVGPLSFSISAGTLPTGLSLNPATGVIAGTPGTAGPFTFTVRVVDANGTFDAQQYTVNIDVPVHITTTGLADWTQNLAGYNQTIATTGGTAPIAFSVSAGALPAGLTLNSASGVISGTPTAAGVVTVTILATDVAGSTDAHDYTFTINPRVAITTPTLADWTVNHFGYSQTIVTTGGTGAIGFAVGTGNLPDGLTLNVATGLISGTPTAIGTFNFSIVATDSLGATDTKSYSVVINGALQITTTSLPNATRNVFYSTTIQSIGGTPPVQYTLYGGLLPNGLSLDANTGVLSGTPSGPDVADLVFQATDATGNWVWSSVLHLVVF